jgi:mono/diheme cytochrome c family protein
VPEAQAMCERFDSMGRVRRQSLLLALGLAAVTAFAACGEETSPAAPGEKDDPSTAPDEEEDKPVKDAGRPKDAGRVVDAGRTEDKTPSEADAGEEAPVTQNSEWCKTKAVLDAKCNACHDGEGTGPMPLLTVDDMLADAPVTKGKKVYEVVGTRIHDAKNPMPPQGKLTAEELATLDAFVEGDKPTGDEAVCNDEGTEGGGTEGGADEFGWDPSKCDEIYKIFAHGATKDDPATVAPGAETHPQVYWDAPWGNEKVQMINTRTVTDNKKVLHHWILYSAQGAFLTGWAPGDDKRGVYPDDIGMNMPTGARSLRLDMHYFNTQGTQTEEDKSGLEICIVKGANLRPKAAAVTMSFTSLGPVLAPAGAVDRPITGTCNVTTTTPVTLMTASPHAHTMATRMVFKLKKKSGEEIVMHDGPFKFGEQESYDLPAPGIVVETGDVVTTTCYYTNPTTRNVTFGESTTSEMCFNFASYWPAGALSCGFGGFPGLGGFGGN